MHARLGKTISSTKHEENVTLSTDSQEARVDTIPHSSEAGLGHTQAISGSVESSSQMRSGVADDTSSSKLDFGNDLTGMPLLFVKAGSHVSVHR